MPPAELIRVRKYNRNIIFSVTETGGVSDECSDSRGPAAGGTPAPGGCRSPAMRAA